MTHKKQPSSPDMLKTISELKSTLVSDPDSPLHKVSFKSYGRRFVITNKDKDLSGKLEKSFNGLLKFLDVLPGNKKIKGLCFLDKKTDAFKVAYMKEGEQILHQIVRKKV
jgi:hypothetical protein